MPRKSLKRVAQENGVSKSSARMETQLLKLRPHETTVIHVCLEAINPASIVHSCSWFLQSVIEGEINPLWAFFSDEQWFHMQGYINTQNNRYWSSQNLSLTYKVLLHPVKVGVWCAVSARIVVPDFS
jgi:hypothetical protein